MVNKKVLHFVLAFLSTLIIVSCGKKNEIDREKLSETLAGYDEFYEFSEGLCCVKKDGK